MPRQNGRFQGTFASYPDGGGGTFPDDEEAIAAACDEMFSMCGNAGQESLIGDYLADFDDWGIDVLEVENSQNDSWDAFSNMVREDWYNGDEQKWRGTELIWAVGYDIVASMYGVHDSHDEQGEGTGR